MSTTKVSALAEKTNTNGNEELLINDGGTSKKVIITNVLPDNSVKVKHLDLISTSSVPSLEAKGTSGSTSRYIKLNCSENSHGIKLLGPPHSATADYTLTFPDDDGNNGQKLTTNGSGVLTWTADANTVYTHPNHSGDVTSSADGAQTIAADAVTYAKMQNVSADERILGRVSGANGIIEELTKAQMLTMLNVEDGSTADQTAAQIKTALQDGIDSIHYVNGSIDTDHIADDQVTAALLANSINTDIATGVTANTTANAALPKAGGTMTGNLVMGTNLVDGIDISARDAVLTSTTTTAGAALPKAGGTVTGNIIHNDNVKALFGTGSDLEIYHNASSSYIKDNGTGNLHISTNGASVILQTSQGEKMVEGVKDGAVNLYHNNVKKLETTAAGIDVTGAVSESAPRSGQVLQRFSVNPNPGHVQRGAASWGEIDTDLRVSITPLFSDSIIEVECILMFGGRFTSNITHFKLYNHTDSADINLDSAGNRAGAHGSVRHVDTDANDVDMITIKARTTASNTNARTYAMYSQNESGTGNKNYFASESNSGDLVYCKPIITVTEIRV